MVKKLKICLFVSTEFTNVTDGQTDGRTPHDGIGRACIASHGKTLIYSSIGNLSPSQGAGDWEGRLTGGR